MADVNIGMPCGACTKEVLVRMSQPRVANLPDVSMLVVTHDENLECPHCRQALGVMLAGLSPQGLVFRTVPVKRKLESSLILPPNGFVKGQ